MEKMYSLLTGKAKEDFERWYITYLRQREDIGDRYFDDSLLRFFWDGGDIMVNAFITSWLDSIGIFISIGYRLDYEHWTLKVETLTGSDYERGYISRHEATKQAILRANKIYNER